MPTRPATLFLGLGLSLALLSVARADEPGAARPGRVDAYGDPLPEGATARLGTVRLVHHDDVKALAWSADGGTLTSAAGDGACVWEAATGKLVRRTGGPADLYGAS